MNSWWHFTFCMQSNSYFLFVLQKDLQRIKTKLSKVLNIKKRAVNAIGSKVWKISGVLVSSIPTLQVGCTAFLKSVLKTKENAWANFLLLLSGNFSPWTVLSQPCKLRCRSLLLELLDLSSVQLYQLRDTQSFCAKSQVSPLKVHWQRCQGINQRLKSLGGSYDSKEANLNTVNCKLLTKPSKTLL